MPGDYSRTRYTPRKGYISVLEQQGRVRLDADGNEFAEAIDRRRRAETIDTIGNGVVPNTTKNAFQILSPAAGQYTIGPGRAYVDGILVDCWGDDASDVFTPDLGEMLGTNPLAYTSQPFYYSSPAFPVPALAGTSIVYLDVWEREVTALEVFAQPGVPSQAQNEYQSLIDPALEGIDTTTRMQVAWQVKALSPTTAAVCSDDPPEWTTLIAPSTGVLTTATTPAPSTASACVIDPSGGYTGLENRLYRVQIQSSGVVDTTPAKTVATFVWSKDNASVGANLVSPITHVSATECQLSVTTVGRDKTFGFQVNDVLEVLDDYVEWSIRETNQGGTFVTVTSVDAENLTINVTPDISATFTVVSARHPRIRKWEALPQPTNNGTAIPLGTEGVTITFGAAPAATLRAGDYWTFCARTATGTIEVLSSAPPRGVLHHYMRLAMTNPPNLPQDCRVFWPPTFGSEGCCTVVVNVGDDIQKAIDSLPREQGGCVCLKAGVHAISKPLTIEERSNVYLHGESEGAAVQNMASGTALQITNRASHITVEHISFATTPSENGQDRLIRIEDSDHVHVRHCQVSPLNANQSPIPGFGFVVGSSDFVELRDNEVHGCLTAVFALLAKRAGNLVIAENFFFGPTVSQENTQASAGVTGIEIATGLGFVRITDNYLTDFAQGVLAPIAEELSITGNIVNRQILVPSTVFNPSWTDPLGTLIQQKAYGIVIGADDARVTDNQVNSVDPGHGGILAYGSGVVIEGNSLSSSVAVMQPPAAPFLEPALGQGGSLLGTYDVELTFTSAVEESGPGPASTAQVGLSTVIQNIPGVIFCAIPPITDPTVTGWRIYGFKRGVSTSFQLIASLAAAQTQFIIAADQNTWGATAPSASYDWPALPVGIVAYKPSGKTNVDSFQIAQNALTGPQKGIAILAERFDYIPHSAVIENRFANSAKPESIDVTTEATYLALETTLVSLGSLFGVLLINTDRTSIGQNTISGCTIGIASLWNLGPSHRENVDGNVVEGCAIGVYLYAALDSTIQNGTMNGNQIAIALHDTFNVRVTGNHCWVSTVASFLDLNSSQFHVEDNIIEGGQTGVLAYLTQEGLSFERNQIQGTQGTGIMLLGCEDKFCIFDNQISTAGLSGVSAIEANLYAAVSAPVDNLQFGTNVSSAIAVVDCAGEANIEHCKISNTGQPAGATAMDICVVGTKGIAHTRVHGCQIVRSGPATASSWGVRVLPLTDVFDQEFASAHVSANHIDITPPTAGTPMTNFLAAEVTVPNFQLTPCDVIFNDNFVLQRGTFFGEFRIVNLFADVVVATGNRIRSTVTGLTIMAKKGVTCTGNAASNNVSVFGGGQILPAPATSNVTV